MTRRTIPVSLLGVKIERLELALIVARVCVMYFRKHIHHPLVRFCSLSIRGDVEGGSV